MSTEGGGGAAFLGGANPTQNFSGSQNN